MISIVLCGIEVERCEEIVNGGDGGVINWSYCIKLLCCIDMVGL